MAKKDSTVTPTRRATPGENRMVESGDANRGAMPRTRPGGSRTFKELESLWSGKIKGGKAEASPAPAETTSKKEADN